MNEDIQNQYVLGFLFDKSGDLVTLIKKRKPIWQSGRMNGVGGKMKIGEFTHDSMIREFEEEAGVNVPEWDHFAIMHGKEWTCYCFRAFSDEYIAQVKTMTDEDIEVVPVVNIITHPKPETTISNIPWLLSVALDKNVSLAEFRYH